MTRKLALISEHASPLSALGGVDSGGQNVYVAQVGRWLSRLGYQVDIFTRRDCPGLPTVVALGETLRVVHVDAGPPQFIPKEEILPLMAPFTHWMLDFMLAQGPYSAVHANFFMSGLAAMRLKEMLGIPFAVTFHALGLVRLRHQGGVDRFPRERTSIEKQVMQAADAIIAECPQDLLDQQQLYEADPAKMAMIPCGFDDEELWPVEREVARQRLGLEGEEKIVLHIGRMVPRKGVDTAIEGFARLVRRHGVKARMLIVGGESDSPDPAYTPEIGRLADVAEQEGVRSLVTFTGRRGRNVLRDYYSAADVFVTTPWYEPFGITPVEAMACGAPVVGSNVGGIKYSVEHGRTGFLTPPDDPEAVGERLATILQDDRLRKAMSAAAIARARSLFTWEGVARDIGGVLERIMVREPALVASPRLTATAP